MIKTVLFDIDGTLLPMDLDVFTKCYFKNLLEYTAPMGYDPKSVYRAVMQGVAKMTANNGAASNEAVFWQAFGAVLGAEACAHKDLFDQYYLADFNKAKDVCGFTPKAAEVIAKIKGKGISLAVASNPLFPMTAQAARIKWAGVDPEDFAHITAYENCHYAKPNPRYYFEILEHLGCKAEETLMVGNDVSDDMAAKNAGLQVFLLTDCIINSKNEDISQYPQGTYDDLWEYIEKNL